jgi:hypothetical protein
MCPSIHYRNPNKDFFGVRAGEGEEITNVKKVDNIGETRLSLTKQQMEKFTNA